jgi:hypothetical protein
MTDLNPGTCCLEFVMRLADWTPSIAPTSGDQTVYLVVDDFGGDNALYRQTDARKTDFETVVAELLEGKYKNPLRVVAFNTAREWSQDVSTDVAHELRQRCDLQLRDVPFFLQDFVDRQQGRYQDYQLPLPIRLA